MRDKVVQNTHSALSGIDLELEVITGVIHLFVLSIEEVSNQAKNVINFMTEIGIIWLSEIEQVLPHRVQLSVVVSYLLIK